MGSKTALVLRGAQGAPKADPAERSGPSMVLIFCPSFLRAEIDGVENCPRAVRGVRRGRKADSVERMALR
jgi:hypothetical protein